MTATEKPTFSRSKSNELRLADGEIAHIGVDVHKANYHVAVVSDQRGAVKGVRSLFGKLGCLLGGLFSRRNLMIRTKNVPNPKTPRTAVWGSQVENPA